jgi:uncharacterized glyoxalase superfamily protein PhnB
MQPFDQAIQGASMFNPLIQLYCKTLFSALAAGGTVQIPLAKTCWSPCFGMLTDRFGISLLINVLSAQCEE